MYLDCLAELCDVNREDIFGDVVSEESNSQRGWLTSDTVVQLKLFGEKGLNVWKKKHKAKDFYIKVTPVKGNRSSLEESMSFTDDSQSLDMNATRDKWQRWPIVEVAVSITVPGKSIALFSSWSY